MASRNIHRVIAREVLNSRGAPTVEVEITTRRGVFRASAPSSLNSGPKEPLEQRDGDAARFGGQGVLKSIKVLNEVVAPKLVGLDPSEQFKIDQILIEQDDPPLGSNAILAVSMAVSVLL